MSDEIIPTTETADLRFTLTSADGKLSSAVLQKAGNEILKSLIDKTGIASARAWFEAGGYAKWSKGGAVKK